MPAHRPGDFSLGRWFLPVAVVAFGYAAGVIVIALAPHEGHIAAVYLLGAACAIVGAAIVVTARTRDMGLEARRLAGTKTDFLT